MSLRATWIRHRQRLDHWNEFKTTGAYHVRRMADMSNYDEGKLKDARDWLNQQDTRHQRRAFWISSFAAVVSVLALLVSYYSYENARMANRAWLGPAAMRLSKKPGAGEELRFFLDYQNTGHQPAQDVFYEMDSYSFNKDMTPGIEARAARHIARCKNSQPSDERLTLFPGTGTFEPYRVDKQLAAAAGPREAIFVDGCFVYRTLGEVHRTAFCFTYDLQNGRDDETGKPVMNLCTHGHYAD
jgi:hypothetical protein